MHKNLAIKAGGELRRAGYVTRATLVATLALDPNYGPEATIFDVAYSVEVEVALMVPRKVEFVEAGSDAEERVIQIRRFAVGPKDAAILVAMR